MIKRGSRWCFSAYCVAQISPCIRSAWWIRLFLLNMPPVWCGASCGSRNPIVVETLLEYTSEKNFGQEIMADYLSEKLCFYSVKLPLHYCKVVFHITVIQSVVFPRLLWYEGRKKLGIPICRCFKDFMCNFLFFCFFLFWEMKMCLIWIGARKINCIHPFNCFIFN